MSSFSVQLNLALRNSRRNIRRTLLTAVTVFIGTAIATLSISFLKGYVDDFLEAMANNHGHVRVVTDAFAEREVLQPLYENIPESDPLIEALLEVPGVEAAEAVIRSGVVLAPGEEIGEDFGMLIGASDSWFERMEVQENIVAGRWIEPGAEEIVIGRKVAMDLGVEVGQEILVLGQTQYGSMSPMTPEIVGIVSYNGLLDSQLYASLETSRWLVDIPDGSVEVLVYGETHDPAASRALVERLGGLDALDGLNLRGWYDDPFAAQILPVMNVMYGFIAGLMMFVMVLAIFNTMTMSVMERTAEIGVMRAMGQTRRGAVGLFIVEAATIGLIGGIAGVTVGGLAGYHFEVNGVNIGQEMVDQVGSGMPVGAVIYGDVTPGIIGLCLALGLATAAIGALLPAIRAASIQPSQAMRARR